MTAAPSAKINTTSARQRSAASTPAWLFATFFGIGRLPWGPGTWASAATVLLWWVLAYVTAISWHTPMAAALASLAIVGGIPAATKLAREYNLTDPSFVVIDEVAGQLIALIAVPVRWKTLLVSFILFRIFDIWKPPPLRRLETLPDGTGIILDDVAAGAYALAVMHIFLYLRWL